MLKQCIFLYLLALIFTNSMAQEIIALPQTMDSEDIPWTSEEKRYHSTYWDTEVVTNVSKASLLAYLPKKNDTGVAMIICPGGGMYGHSIMSEGIEVAQWLQERGVAAFVLKYRLVPTGEDGTEEITRNWNNDVIPKAKQVLPLAASDAMEAIKLLRSQAERYHINPDMIGLMGFSAGGAVTMQTTYTAPAAVQPNFIAPIYAWMDIVKDLPAPEKSIPAFIACASDDPLRLAPASVQLYEQWIAKGYPSESVSYTHLTLPTTPYV